MGCVCIYMCSAPTSTPIQKKRMKIMTQEEVLTNDLKEGFQN